jgi:hypothetical protein
MNGTIMYMSDFALVPESCAHKNSEFIFDLPKMPLRHAIIF